MKSLPRVAHRPIRHSLLPRIPQIVLPLLTLLALYISTVPGSGAGREALKSLFDGKSLDLFEERGEAIWKIEVEDFPAFILVDDKGHDFFADVGPGCSH